MEFGVQVGGLNQSEFEDLNAFSGTPTRFHSDLGDTFVATWKLIPPGNCSFVVLFICEEVSDWNYFIY